MGLRVNNNIAALNSYNSLQKSDKAMGASLSKLSSGYRINKAADDAAGLVVSEGLRSQIGGLTQASRNAQDGVNVAQTVDGALGTQTTILQRMRDLAVQAANSGSQDTTATAAADSEFQQLASELTRISSTTSFGSQQLLNGTYNQQFQIGANNTVNDRLGINLTSTVFGTPVTASSGTQTTFTVTSQADATYTYASGSKISLSDGVNSLVVTLGSATTLGTNLKSALDTAISAAGLGGKFTIAASGGTGANVFTVTTTGAGNRTVTMNAVDAATGLATNIAGTTTTAGTDAVLASASGFSAAGLHLDTASLTGAASNAQAAIAAVDNALKGVNSARATIGAVQNRFENTISNLAVSIENVTASESAIRDTDMAAEMTKFTKNQILTQAGTSMLAQANSSTQNILTLLRG